MFIKNVHGKEAINQLAESIGCQAGEAIKGAGYGRPGLVGNTFPIKEQLKAAGAKFDAENRAWTFESWADLESAINSIKESEHEPLHRSASRRGFRGQHANERGRTGIPERAAHGEAWRTGSGH